MKCETGADGLEKSVIKWLEKLAGGTAVLPCTSKASKNQISVQLKKVDVKRSETKCFPKHPLMPITCRVAFEETKLVMDGKNSFSVKRLCPFNLTLALTANDGEGVKLAFRNITSGVNFRYGVSLATISCPLLKNSIWTLFESLHDSLMSAFILTKMPDFCTL